jgi:hypothetical protein
MWNPNLMLNGLAARVLVPTVIQEVSNLQRHMQRRYILTCSVFTILWCVERWLCKQEIVIFWLCTKILKYALLKKPLHEVPIFNQTMSHRVLENKCNCYQQ